jgi:tRNA uridine 5-carboxymethylaminomethyl modification enzyme
MQVRQLNTSKGPAVRAVRAQCDKSLYAMLMKEELETQERLDLLQDAATGVILEDVDSAGRATVVGITTGIAGTIYAPSVIVTAGTFLRARMVSGTASIAGGRAGDTADTSLAGSLLDVGIRLRRFKTGTPPRIDSRTIDISETTPQPGDDTPLWLSREGAVGEIDPVVLPPARDGIFSRPELRGSRMQVACYQTSTTAAAHELIRANLDRAPMYNGSIEGTGPRYCPSIEDKVGRFADKDAHPIYIEPEGWRSHEAYIQGLSTSLPPDVQDAVLRHVPGLRDASITRYGYAVEYDAVDPTELMHTLESTRVEGLYLAGQVNGTSGYEEAAGQGLVAGVNAAARVLARPALRLRRDEGYIGVMIDDLVSLPFDEPYRMLTSRAEFRLLLRQDTADRRMQRHAAAHDLTSPGRQHAVERECAQIDSLIETLGALWLGDNARHAEALETHGIEPARRSLTALDIARRPGVPLGSVIATLTSLGMAELPTLPPHVLSQAEIAVRYGAFIDKERREAERHLAAEEQPVPPDIDFSQVVGMRVEAAQRLGQRVPATIAQARRTAGVTPTDIGALLVHLRRVQLSGTTPERTVG